MHSIRINRIVALVALLAIFGFASASIPSAHADDETREPELPSPACDSLQVPPGHKVSFHVYALGVQVYRWDGTSWVFVGPEATLYADANYRGKVGIHYGGPTWESNDGGNVVARRVAGCSVDPSAIDWLRLEAVSTEGPGIFSSVTYIQRVNTVGGKAPANAGTSINEVKKVPYTTEYYFYRAQD